MIFKRKEAPKIKFKDLSCGDVFTINSNGYMYIKLLVNIIDKSNKKTNAVYLADGDVTYVNPDDEVYIVNGKFVEE